MQVRDIMTTDVVTVDAGATLRDVVGKLLARGVGSAVVVDDRAPVGMVTETDALCGAYEASAVFADLGVAALCDRKVRTTDPDASVTRVGRRMREAHVKKFPVVVDLGVVGIVTLTDMVFAVPELPTGVNHVARERDGWTDED